ncbi:chemotaxis protein CheD [Melghiribacillus thermohalophilus]|uniref:Probable chemoreceptor glutamine deamidase CheD n=1 Tax=Melghiribacillus thermohalophilus TaxID=1324956 RepID=A0A4R3NH11_9BACI|nr:chemotaxis protein CheD [Melghiribacillus thermohalophilus]TCT26748.1 chemotaxis protein CheD [Melghiribacillus thermohalophilus]
MNKLKEVVKVGIADLNIVRAPGVIRTSGLGSCVGVVIYDLNQHLAGLAHVMLPDSSLAKGNALNKAKYADTAIKELLDILIEEGAKKYALKAKMAGGAQMFQFSSGGDMMRIGPRNVEAVKKQLERFRIPIVAEDVGGRNGRTIEFNPESGMLNIRTVNLGVKDI